MDDRDELPVCRQPKKSPWQQFCEFFSQNPFGQILINLVSDLIKYVALLALFYWCRCAWIFPNYVRERRLVEENAKYKEENLELKAELKKLDSTKADDSRATSNPGHPPSSVSEDQTQGIISARPRNSFRDCNSIDTGVEENVIENQGEITAEVRISIPKSPKSEEVVRIAQNSKILGPSPVSIKGSRILEKEVIVRDDILDELSGLADSCTIVDNRVTVQLGDCRIFIRTDEGVQQLELDTDRDKLPVILHASYAAGKLTIEGLNLENATLKAATFDKSILLKKAEHKQILNELGVCTWFGQLPSNNYDKVYVRATKTISIQEHEVLVTSSVVKIQDDNLRTVVRFGIPPTILMIYIASQLYQDGKKLIKSSNLGPTLAWIVPLSFVILLPILPSSTENKIRELLEHVHLIFLVLYSSTWNFLFKQHLDLEDAKNSKRKYEHDSLDGGSKESDDDAIDNFVVGNVSQNATNVTLIGVLVSLTESIAQIGKLLIDIMNSNDEDFNPGIANDTKPDAIGDHGSSNIGEGDDPYWKWQAYQEYESKFGSIKLKKCDDNQNESTPVKVKPFEVVYGLKEKLWSKRDYIRIFSPSLILEIIKLLIPRIIYASSEDSIEVYASELFHIREKLKEIGLKGVNHVFPGKLPLSKEDREKLQIHVGHLLRFMDKELEHVVERYSIMERRRHVSWDMLWAFFPVGTKVVYQCAITNEKLLGIVIGVAYEKNLERGEFLNVDIEKWDYNCNTWKAYKKSQQIYRFGGDCIFNSLQMYPLPFSNDPEKDKKEFLKRGEVFCELSMLVRNRFMNYSGLIYMQKSINGCVMLMKEIASGRVMVDLGSFAKMNPDYMMGSAEPPCEVLRDNIVVTKDIITSPERIYSPAMVYGFSFRLKKWGMFQVCSFSEIVFNDSAFDALVMPERRKVLLEKLVREYMPEGNTATPQAGIHQVVRDEASSQQIDPIVSKGEGCIILCYGPPGTGKTLTAESIAEKLHAPLWSLSVSELGTTPNTLESYLVKVLDVATTWSAILLLDEADVYLEKRSSFNLTRTAMTGIFLRNLEYYRGVLFLTTNRIVTFDEAFRSRISMILYYEINRDDRQKIWSTILSRTNMKNIADDQLDRLSEPKLNGRDIRNVVHRATILSKNNIGGRLTFNDIQQSLDELVESLKVYTEKRALQSSEERSYSE